MHLHSLLVERVRLPLYDAQGALGAISQAGSQAVAETVLDHLCLSASDLYRSLGAGQYALAASIALRFVDLDDLPDGHANTSLT